MLNQRVIRGAEDGAGRLADAVRTVEVVEDDPSMQRALAMALRAHGFVVDVYGCRQDYQNASRPAGPRVLILDMRLPDGTGLEIQEWLALQAERVPVIFLSGQSTSQEIIDALKAGAHDFLLKPVRLADLIEVVEQAFQRHADAMADASRGQHLRQRWDRLTPREKEVCVLMLRGMANREIARVHGSVPGTVKVHRARVLEKMGVTSLAALFELTQGEDLSAWLPHGKEGP